VSSQAWLLPALPFAAALVGLLFGRRLPGGPAPLAVLATAAAGIVSVGVLLEVIGDPNRVREAVTELTPTGGVHIAVGTRVDGLAAVVAVMVCAVALLVQVYSTAYLHGDPRYSSYAAEVSLFTAAMLLVVVAADLFELLVGWEVMGVCSYLLIGHYWSSASASAAAVKAFIMTRVGDVGFLFGIFTLGLAAHSFRITDILRQGGSLSHGAVVAATLLLACGVVGKSAQFPLHTWLPDAMAGPTPISALIHAATMVAAGVYVVARLYPLFLLSPVTLGALGVLAAITMVLAALAALAQDDLKRVLAYSTVSQLAYMVGALAVGGYTAGVFHLLTHAAFKALLFLGAGAVLHTVGTNLMSEMGGLRRAMPVTFVTTTIGLAALAGVPPFAGFFSKEAVLGAAYESAFGPSLGRPPVPRAVAVLVLVAAMGTVLLTAAYVTRLWLRTFLGGYRGSVVVREAPLAMTGPLVLLAVPAALLGLAGLSSGGLARWVGGAYDVGFFTYTATPSGPGELFHPAGLAPEARTAWLSLALVLVGVVGALLAWRRAPTEDPARLLGRLRRPFDRAFYLDELYDVALVRPIPRLARAVAAFDTRGVDGAVNGSGAGAWLLGGGLRRLQNGNVQSYATGLLLGVVLIAASVAVLS